jgi:hypothetical protein
LSFTLDYFGAAAMRMTDRHDRVASYLLYGMLLTIVVSAVLLAFLISAGIMVK